MRNAIKTYNSFDEVYEFALRKYQFWIGLKISVLFVSLLSALCVKSS